MFTSQCWHCISQFLKQCLAGMREGVTNQLNITDFTADVVKSMLRCLYKPDYIEREMSKCGASLMIIANKYLIYKLKAVLERHIIPTLTLANCIHLFSWETYIITLCCA